MDLSFSRPIPATDAALPAADMAVLVTLLHTRQEASATALAQGALDQPPAAAEPLLAPASGAFSTAMAARIAGWRCE